MWMYDIAREQSPTLGDLRRFCDLTHESGFNAIGLYFEHRFAYPSTPWSHGKGCVTPESIDILQQEYKDLQIIPFINLLGHFEGMLYTEHGKRYREELFKGMQADPTNSEFVALAHTLVDDTLNIFNSEIIHIGGDETQQLGAGARSKAKVAEFEQTEGVDGKARLYGDHFGPLAQRVVAAGRRPAVWGDMYLEHPQALDLMPKETLIFDWQYFKNPIETSRGFAQKGFEVVTCPAIHTYNATWCHLPQSEQNVRDCLSAAHELDAYGVCVTTWECGLFGNYETLIPAIRACGGLLSQEAEQGAGGREQGTEKVAASGKKSPITYLPTLQDPEPNVNDISVAFAICDSILINALKGGAEEIVLFVQEDQIFIQNDGKPGGSLPMEQESGVLNRFKALSNIDMIGKLPVYHGRLAGTYREPFAFQVEFVNGPTWKLTLGLEGKPKASVAQVEYKELTDAPAFLAEYQKESEAYGEWARLMGCELQSAGGTFAFGGIRSSIKVRLLLNANPFLCWMHHQEELTGEVGDKALAILDHALAMGEDSSTRGVAEFGKLAIQFVRYVDQARQAYAQGLPGVAVASLTPCRQIFDQLEKIATATNLNVGGSLADIERCKIAREHVDRVIRRIRDYGDGALGYLPAFEYLCHPKFVPHDQAAWWLINKWANE